MCMCNVQYIHANRMNGRRKTSLAVQIANGKILYTIFSANAFILALAIGIELFQNKVEAGSESENKRKSSRLIS